MTFSNPESIAGASFALGYDRSAFLPKSAWFAQVIFLTGA
jgi:hypothetical protein